MLFGRRDGSSGAATLWRRRRAVVVAVALAVSVVLVAAATAAVMGAAAPAGSQYNNNGTAGNASIYVDPDTHNIVVTSDAITAEQISNVIASLDVPKPQVLIKVVFVEVDLNNDSDIGAEGGMVNNSGGLSQSAGKCPWLSGLNWW